MNIKKLRATGVTFFVLAMLSGTITHAQIETDTSAKYVAGMPKGNLAPATNFTGMVWVNRIATDSLAFWSISKVTFEPGAHSNWHRHPGKQVLIIIEGTGYLKQKGRAIQVLHKGDVVTIQPGVEHWHGATPDHEFVQLVVNPDIEKGVVTWLGKVTDKEYRSLK